jgi:hypothetical protein
MRGAYMKLNRAQPAPLATHSHRSHLYRHHSHLYRHSFVQCHTQISVSGSAVRPAHAHLHAPTPRLQLVLSACGRAAAHLRTQAIHPHPALLAPRPPTTLQVAPRRRRPLRLYLCERVRGHRRQHPGRPPGPARWVGPPRGRAPRRTPPTAVDPHPRSPRVFRDDAWHLERGRPWRSRRHGYSGIEYPWRSRGAAFQRRPPRRPRL